MEGPEQGAKREGEEGEAKGGTGGGYKGGTNGRLKGGTKEGVHKRGKARVLLRRGRRDV